MLNSLEGTSLPSGIVISAQRISIGLRVGVIISAGSRVAGRGGVIAGGRSAVRGGRGSVAGLRGSVGRSAVASGSGAAAGTEQVKSKEVDGQEGEETKKESLGDQVDGVPGTGEVQLAGPLIVIQLGLRLSAGGMPGAHDLFEGVGASTEEDDENSGGLGTVHVGLL